VSGFSGHINIVLSSWRRLRSLLPLVLALVVVSLPGGSPRAQELSGAERTQLLAQKETLFQKMLREPGNLDTAFTYADVSAKLGDNEAAVSALERMLLFNPDLPRVQLELGTLYFRMGSFEIARTYFERAAAANPPEEVKERIAAYLGEVSRLSAPQRFSGYFSFGAQYQSDANLAGSQNILGINLLPQFAKHHDENVFATGSVLYSYDLGTQTRDTIEISGTGFANHYSSVRRLDLGLVETTAGPRFNFPEPVSWVHAASLKPYLIANDVSLGGNQYFHTLGTGGEATAQVLGDVRLKSVFEFRQKNFNDAPDRPLSRGFNGSDKLVTFSVNKPITAVPQSDLTLEFDFLDQGTRPLPNFTTGLVLPYFSNRTYAGAASYHIHYDDPTGLFRLPLETNFFVSRSWAYYAAPDPCCGAVRFERHWRFGITQSFPLSQDVSMVAQVQRDIVSSLPLYNYTSTSFLVGPQIRF
jgi:TPR repeat protein